MDLLKQCQQWFEQDEAQKVIDTLEAIPAEERTPELDSELAKAYIGVAAIGEAGRALWYMPMKTGLTIWIWRRQAPKPLNMWEKLFHQ